MQTVRRRVVSRARVLQTNAEFLAAIRASVARWNREYPDFPTEQRSGPRGLLRFEAGGHTRPDAAELVFQPPPDLTRALQEATPRLQALEARSAWQERMEVLANRWWNPAIFPRWLGGIAHPAAAFVRACHMWEPPLLDVDAWILPATLLPRWVEYDLTGSGSLSVDASRWADRYFRLYELLTDDLRAGTVITRESLAELDSKAGYEARMQALARPRQQLAFLPIYPGVERRDHRAAESLVLSLAGDGLHEAARELRQRGWSDRHIAGELGVNRKTIARWLDPK